MAAEEELPRLPPLLRAFPACLARTLHFSLWRQVGGRACCLTHLLPATCAPFCLTTPLPSASPASHLL